MTVVTDVRRIERIHRHATHLRVPSPGYPGGRTIAWARRRPADQLWEVRILTPTGDGPRETHLAADWAEAERLMLARTPGVSA